VAATGTDGIVIRRPEDPRRRRIRAACCPVHALGPGGLERHIAGVERLIADGLRRKRL